MRQAGRYLPEYRDLRAKAGSFLDLCYDPNLASEVTLQPLRRFDFDAAILFSDILVVPHAMGLDLSFVENEGPKLEKVRDGDDVAKLGDGRGAWQFERVYETVCQVKGNLSQSIGFIGFCGAPWTVASYMIEGESSNRALALQVARDNPDWFVGLMTRLVEVSTQYLIGQIKAGVEAVQVFDSWAGDVPADLRERLIFEPCSQIVKRVRSAYPGFPIIVFGRGLDGAHGKLAEATGASAVGVEENADLQAVFESLPPGCSLQGNLAPEFMSNKSLDLREAVRKIVSVVPMERHVFNLGHGIRPDADPSRVTEMLRLIREFDGTS